MTPVTPSTNIENWCANLGGMVGGPAGGLVGRFLGLLLEKAIPGLSDITGGLITDALPGIATSGKKELRTLLGYAERENINRELQQAFRDAFRNALWDIGGAECFPGAWRGRVLDVPLLVQYPKTDRGATLWRIHSELAAQIRSILQKIDEAVEENNLLPLQPLQSTSPEEGVYYYLQVEYTDRVGKFFFEKIIEPYLRGLGTFRTELQEFGFEKHLQTYLLDRTLYRLGALLKVRSEAWRAFNRLLLEHIKEQISEVAAKQERSQEQYQEILQRLNTLLAKQQTTFPSIEAGPLGKWADGMADLISALGEEQKQQNEQLASFIERVLVKYKHLFDILQNFTTTAERIEYKVDKIIRHLDDGGLIVEGAPPISVRLKSNYVAILEEHRSLFAGRNNVLTQIERFFVGPGGYLLVEGLAGYGKTALFVHLIQTFDQESIIYHFFSHSIGSTSEREFQENLAQQLLAHHKIGGRLPQDLFALRALCIELLQTPAPLERPIYLLVDALDEADFSLYPYFVKLGEGVHLLFSARKMADRDWFDELNLHGRAESITLSAMDRKEIVCLLQTVDQAQEDVESLIQDLEQVTVGDPFFLRILVEDMKRDRQRANRELARIVRAVAQETQENGQALHQLHSGLKRYFDRWWQEVATTVEEKAIEQLLGYLTAAIGPLSRADLIAIDSDDALRGFTVDHALDMVRRFLIGDEERGYALCHYRFREYVATRFGGDLTIYLKKLLSYCTRWEEHRSPYTLRYYVRHLAANSQWEEIHQLVATGKAYQSWAEARHSVEGSYLNYLDDLYLAWDQADKAGQVGRQVRYALIESSIYTVAANIPPLLLKELLVQHYWTPDAILNYIRLRRDESRQAEALVSLAPYLPSEQGREAFIIASSFSNNFYHLQASSALLLHLPIEQRGQVVERVLATIKNLASENEQTAVLFELAPYVPESRLQEVLTLALEMKEFLNSGSNCVKILAALLPHLPSEQKTKILALALEAANSIISESNLDSIDYQIQRENNHERSVNEILKERNLPFTPFTPLMELESLRLSRGKREKASLVHDYVVAVNRLLPYMPTEQKIENLSRALEIADRVEDASYRRYALSKLAVHLPPEQRRIVMAQAYAADPKIVGDYVYEIDYHVWMVIERVSDLSAEQAKELWLLLFKILKNLTSTNIQFAILNTLLPHLPKDLVKYALEVVGSFYFSSERIRSLNVLAPYLPTALLERALAATRYIGDSLAHFEILAKFLSYLPAEQKSKVLLHILTGIKSINNEFGEKRRVAWMLIDLIPHLNTKLKTEKLAYVLEVAGSSHSYNTSLLIAAIPHLPSDWLIRVLEIIENDNNKFSNTSDLTAILSILVPRLSPDADLLIRLLNVIGTWQSETERVKVLTILTNYLSSQPESLAHALKMVKSMDVAVWRADALVLLVPYLSQDMRLHVLDFIMHSDDSIHRAQVWLSLVPYLPSELLMQTVESILRSYVGNYYNDIVRSIDQHLPIEQRNQTLTKALEIAINLYGDEYLAWSLASLVPYLPSEQQLAASTTALTIASKNNYIHHIVVAKLLPYLPLHLRQEMLLHALKVAQSIDNGYVRVGQLIDLLPHLLPEQRAEILIMEVDAIEQSKHFTRILVVKALLPHLKPEQQTEVLISSLEEIVNSMVSLDVLANCLSDLSPLQNIKVLRRILEIIEDSTNNINNLTHISALKKFAPQLPPDLLAYALQIVEKISDENHRGAALIILAPHLPPSLLAAALKIAVNIEYNSTNDWGFSYAEGRSSALSSLCFFWIVSLQHHRQIGYQVWLDVLHTLVRRPRGNVYGAWNQNYRADLLFDLQVLVPVVTELGGMEATVECVEAILDVGRWWP